MITFSVEGFFFTIYMYSVKKLARTFKLGRSVLDSEKQQIRTQIDTLFLGNMENKISETYLGQKASILFYILIFLFTAEIYPQSGMITVKGIARDGKTNERISSAILTDGKKVLSISDSSGFFSFALPPGSYKIECRQIGYSNSVKNISLGINDHKLMIFFNMKQQPVETEKVTITGKRFKDLGNITNYELKNGDILNVPVFFESDAMRAVQSLPGVTSSHDLSSLVYLRGGNFDETLIAIDDAPAYNLFHLGGAFGSVSPDIVESEILYPSNYPVNFQGALSGVLSIQSKSGNRERLKGSTSLGLMSSKIYIDSPLPLGSIIFFARRTYPDLLSKLLNNLKIIPNGGFPYYFYDLNGKYTLPIDTRNLFTISAFYTKDVYNPFFDTEPPYLEKKEDLNWGNRIVQSSFNHIFDNGVLKAGFYYSESYFRSDTKRYPNLSDLYYRIPGDSVKRIQHINIRNYIKDYSFKAEYEFQMTGQQVHIGTEYKKLSTDYNWDIKENELADQTDKSLAGVFFDFAPDIYSSNDNTDVYSFFMSDKIQLMDVLTVQLGYRGLYIKKVKAYLNSPYVLLNYNVSPDIAISAAYGLYYEYFFTRRDIINGKLFTPYAAYFISDDASRIPASVHYSMGIKLNKLPLNFHTEIEAYYKTRRNISTSDALTRSFSLNNGYSYGIDVLLKNENEIVNGWIAYSFSRSVKNNGIYRYYTDYDRTHNIKLSLSHNLSERWELNALWIYATGLPYTPAIGKYVGTEYGVESLFGYFLPDNKTLDVMYGRKNTRRFPDYHRLDIGITGSFIWGTFIAKPYIQVMNVYNSANPFKYVPKPLKSNDENEIDLGSMIVPTIGLMLEF